MQIFSNALLRIDFKIQVLTNALLSIAVIPYFSQMPYFVKLEEFQIFTNALIHLGVSLQIFTNALLRIGFKMQILSNLLLCIDFKIKVLTNATTPYSC